MSNILLATLDYLPQRGGVARYLGAIKQTFPEKINVLYWNTAISRMEMMRELITVSKGHSAVWVSHVLPVGTMAYFAKFITGIPYTVFLHGMDFDLARRDSWKRFLTRRILKNAQHIVVNSNALAQEVRGFVGRDSLVVYPSIADSFLHEGREYNPEDKKLREQGKVRIVTVSRLVERKGHVDVLEAIRYLPNVEYLIVGDGGYRNRINMRIKDLNLQHCVQMLGEVNDQELMQLYKSADIFVMPTKKSDLDREGFGIVYLEAQLFGLPVIGSNHEGVDEAVINRSTGFLVRGTQELRDAIKKLADNAQLRRRMGRAGREYVLAGFTRDKQFSKLEKIM
jgi:phosphatidyl-myo-inositol dimannoside synthase